MPSAADSEKDHDGNVAPPELTTGQWVDKELNKIDNELTEYRMNTVKALPGIVVNNSSNVIGATQLVAEVLMFKSGGFNIMEKQVKDAAGVMQKVRPQKIFDYVQYPFDNVVGAVFKRSFQDFKFTNFVKPEFYSDFWRSMKDLKTASILDSKGGTVKLTNNWSARSGFAGMTAMTIAMLLPDEKNTPEETEKMVSMAKQNPLGYAGLRYYQALNPLEWIQHKRQFSGLGMTMAGVFSFLSGFRQVVGKDIGMQHYVRNPWQMAGGVITAFAGTLLTLGVDSQQAWTNFGTTQIARLATLPPSISNRFKTSEQGAEWYLGAQAVLQLKNFMAALIGGAEKRTDPETGKEVIIDHVQIRKEARTKVKEKIAERKAHGKGGHADEAPAETTHVAKAEVKARDEAPDSTVSHVKAEMAMPERRAHHQEAMQASV